MKNLEEVLSWRIECLKLNHNLFEVTIGITFLSFSYLDFTITILKLQTVWRLELYVFMIFVIIIVLCLQQECVMIWHYNFFFEIQSTLRKLGILNDRWTAYIWIKIAVVFCSNWEESKSAQETWSKFRNYYLWFNLHSSWELFFKILQNFIYV